MTKFSEADLFTLPTTFMGAPYGRPGAKNRAAILGIPFDCGTHPTRIGARGGPAPPYSRSGMFFGMNSGHAMPSTSRILPLTHDAAGEAK